MMTTPEIALGPVPVPAPQPREVKATFVIPHPGPGTALPEKLASRLKELEKGLGQPLILIVQEVRTEADSAIASSLDDEVRDACVSALRSCPSKQPVTVLLHSAGGNATAAFQVARSLQRHCGASSVLVPRYAKSAATLFALGASKIVLDDIGELGPLDVQLFDVDKERFASGLDEVQSLERLHGQALSMLDSTMTLLIQRTGKRLDALLPHSISYVTNFMRPLLEKIDAVHYTATARLLRVAEMYATRLLRGAGYSDDQADLIAAQLTQGYPEHGFAIDIGEAESLGLKVESMPEPQRELLADILPALEQMPLVGRLS